MAQHLAVASAPRGSSHPRGVAPERFEGHSTNNANAACRASGIQLCSVAGPCTNLLEAAAVESGPFLDQRSKSQTCRYRCGSWSREPIGALDAPAYSALPSEMAKVQATGRPSRRLRRCVSSSQAPALHAAPAARGEAITEKEDDLLPKQVEDGRRRRPGRLRLVSQSRLSRSRMSDHAVAQASARSMTLATRTTPAARTCAELDVLRGDSWS